MAMCKEVGACPVPAGEDVDCNCFGCSGFDKDAYASANDGIMTWTAIASAARVSTRTLTPRPTT